MMIPRIKSVKPLKGYILQVVFDDGYKCFYDVGDDIESLKGYEDLKNIHGLFEQVQLDESRTCIFWNDYIDLPSDTIYEYGKPPAWVVQEVQPRPDYTLLLTFADGERRIYNARPLLEKPIYSELTNITLFLNAKVECGTVTWSDDLDIAPEHLYECSLPIENT